MNYDLLNEEMDKKRVSYEEMADYLDIDLSTFYRKMDDKTSPFSIKQANLIKEKLKLSEKKSILIFLTPVRKSATNAKQEKEK